MAAKTHSPIHGLLAEFDKPEALVEAARQARAAGYTKVEAFSPMPIHALDGVLGLKNRLPFFVLAGGITGMLTGAALQYWTSVIEYPTDIGGRPWLSWPAFVVPMFETTILFAALTAVFGMLIMNGLPQPYHPLFHVKRFAEATRSRFFFLIEAEDPKFDLPSVREFLARQKPTSIEEVPN
ncbi:MAG: DUF3341 domain-containing protein [Planctomycetes bacterium]|nr:DUF3341 domain-containing protein [Planctomycetota bacterium]